MEFTSSSFLIFLATALIVYFCFPRRYRWLVLLIASYYFYSVWNLKAVPVLLAVTTLNFLSGIAMSRAGSVERRRLWLLIGLLSSLGMLFGCKYLGLFGELFAWLTQPLARAADFSAFSILVPIGISFYTLQALNYTIDVYRARRDPETHYGIFALYVSFFPQLVAGPISRSTDLLPQLHAGHPFEYDRVRDGLRLAFWGYFKKLVIADRLAVLVNSVYGDVPHQSGTALIVATYVFAFQIYYDFSAYSDIAIGLARIFGFDLQKNFNRPYSARSINEFWKRWHISLTSWFKDYLWMILRMAWYYSIPLVFLASGLWHGANWTYLVWGGLNGLYLVFAIWSVDYRSRLSNLIGLTAVPRLRRALKVLVTFHLIWFSWIFFRAGSVAEALTIMKRIFGALPTLIGQISSPVGLLGQLAHQNYGLTTNEIAMAVLFVIFAEVLHLLQIRYQLVERLDAGPIWIRWPAYYAVVLLVVLFGRFEVSRFIYAQF